MSRKTASSPNMPKNGGISIVIDHTKKTTLQESHNNNNSNNAKNVNNINIINGNGIGNGNGNNECNQQCPKPYEATKIKIYQDMPTTGATIAKAANTPQATMNSTTVTAKNRTSNSPTLASKVLSKLHQISTMRSKSTKCTKTCININGNPASDNDIISSSHHHDIDNDVVPLNDHHNDDCLQSNNVHHNDDAVKKAKETGYTNTTAIQLPVEVATQPIVTTICTATELPGERGKLDVDVEKVEKMQQPQPTQFQPNVAATMAYVKDDSNNDRIADVSVIQTHTMNANGNTNQNEIMTNTKNRNSSNSNDVNVNVAVDVNGKSNRLTTIIKCNNDDEVEESHTQRGNDSQAVGAEVKVKQQNNYEHDDDDSVACDVDSNDESHTPVCAGNGISINGLTNTNNVDNSIGAAVGISINGSGQHSICESVSKLDSQPQPQPQPQPHPQSYEQTLDEQAYNLQLKLKLEEPQQQQQNQHQQHHHHLGNVCATQQLDSRITKADCASALTETVKNAAKDIKTQTNSNSHVVKIQINQTINLIENQKVCDNTNQQYRNGEKQVTVVKVNENNNNNINNNNCDEKFVERTQTQISDRIDLHLNIEKMVQKPTGNGISTNSVTQMVGGSINSGGTTVTELNVNNSAYLYYMMSSGQFSPCDTLDSGTGSDLESNGNNVNGPISPKVPCKPIANGNCNSHGKNCAPKLEMHLKTTKIRVNSPQKLLDKQKSQNHRNGSEHQRAGSLTDSEESEASSLSCDSLHSTEFIRQSSVSPTNKPTPPPPPAPLKIMKSFLPDSLLRDIRDRKFPTNDFESKYGDKSIDEEDETENGHDTFIQHCNTTNKRASLPPPNKIFELNEKSGKFVDTKLNSMPRKYEADKYYNFHVKEHENFRSFGNNNCNSLIFDSSDGHSSVHEDDFVGFKDILFGSNTSTIRSSKGTVRGVKNRVRNGIATFLQLQEPNIKNYKDKDVGKVVLYTTSMGIIRDTYAKCANVKQILRTLLIKFEERDVFMSLEYQQEIKERMHSEIMKVPQLFVEGQHIGDADTVERLNESGELRQLLKPYKSIATAHTCQTCGGYRLLPCPSCKGSKKSVHRNHFTAEFVALKCMNCDEVGLVKCHNC